MKKRAILPLSLAVLLLGGAAACAPAPSERPGDLPVSDLPLATPFSPSPTAISSAISPENVSACQTYYSLRDSTPRLDPNSFFSQNISENFAHLNSPEYQASGDSGRAQAIVDWYSTVGKELIRLDEGLRQLAICANSGMGFMTLPPISKGGRFEASPVFEAEGTYQESFSILPDGSLRASCNEEGAKGLLGYAEGLISQNKGLENAAELALLEFSDSVAEGAGLEHNVTTLSIGPFMYAADCGNYGPVGEEFSAGAIVENFDEAFGKGAICTFAPNALGTNYGGSYNRAAPTHFADFLDTIIHEVVAHGSDGYLEALGVNVEERAWLYGHVLSQRLAEKISGLTDTSEMFSSGYYEPGNYQSILDSNMSRFGDSIVRAVYDCSGSVPETEKLLRSATSYEDLRNKAASCYSDRGLSVPAFLLPPPTPVPTETANPPATPIPTQEVPLPPSTPEPPQYLCP